MPTKLVPGSDFHRLAAAGTLVVPKAGDTEETRGEFNRNFTLFDRYVLDLSRDRPRMIDRRLAVLDLQVGPVGDRILLRTRKRPARSSHGKYPE